MRYIGQTRSRFSVRMAAHRYGAKKGVGCRVIGRAIQKYGWSAFSAEVLETVLPEHADDRERYWIAEFNTLTPNGYNLESGGADRKEVSQQTRELMRQKKLGVKFGPPSEETRRAIGAANKANMLNSPERRRIREWTIKNGHPWIGRAPTQEHRAKLSAASKGKSKSPEHAAKVRAHHRQAALLNAYRRVLQKEKETCQIP